MPETARTRPAIPQCSEAELVARARDGERGAFETLAVRAMPMLAGTARRMLRDSFAAEEAVAEALFKAWGQIQRFRGEAAFSTWLHRIVCRAVADRFRSDARERSRKQVLQERALHGAGSLRAGPLSPLERVTKTESRRLLRRAAEQLPPRQRLVVLLHVWEGLSLADVAGVLSLRYATVKSNLHHARKALREALENPQGGGGMQ